MKKLKNETKWLYWFTLIVAIVVVYKVLDNDTIDSILAKYNITKEMLADYNDIENIIPGDKLIIPTNEK